MDVWNNLQSADPLELFALWLQEAERSEPNDPNAAALATSTLAGQPSVRMVLVKRADERGFCFFTNAESRKGSELQTNPRAALCFHWKTLRRQVRV
jgi:pyridoxamine 5'-phosphate oxidase